MSVTTNSHTSLPPIKKWTARQWKTLPEKGGSVAINDVKLKQGFLGNLEKKSCIELEELIMRQDKLLSNQMFIDKLPDKGQKIKNRRDDLQRALEQARKNGEKQEVLPDINALEWQWRDPMDLSKSMHHEINGASKDILDSDDDEDPLELLAHHSSAVPPRRSNQGAPEDDPADAIREELWKLELNDNSVSKTVSQRSDSNQPSWLGDFGSKTIASLEKKSKPREVFKPFRPRLNQNLLPANLDDVEPKAPTSIVGIQNTQPGNTKVPQKEDKKSISSMEQTSITVNLSNEPVFGAPAQLSSTMTFSSYRNSPLWASGSNKGNSCTKLVSLRESVTLEREALQRAKKAQLEEATARLKESKLGSNPNSTHRIFSYRDVNTAHHLLEQDLDEVGDVFTHHRGVCIEDSSESSEGSDQED